MSEQIKKEVPTAESINEKTILRVKTSTSPKSLAGSITTTMKEYGHVSLRCIGDGAIGRGLKAATIASGYLKPIGVDVKLKPYFFETEIDGEPRTGLAINIEPE